MRRRAANRRARAEGAHRGQESGTYKPIHSIEHLLETLQELGEEIPEEVWATQDLTDYSGASRYKIITGEEDAPPRESATDATKAARTTLSWCTKRIGELRPDLELPHQIGQHAAPPATPPDPAKGSAKAPTRPPVHQSAKRVATSRGRNGNGEEAVDLGAGIALSDTMMGLAANAQARTVVMQEAAEFRETRRGRLAELRPDAIDPAGVHGAGLPRQRRRRAERSRGPFGGQETLRTIDQDQRLQAAAAAWRRRWATASSSGSGSSEHT